MAVGTGFWKSTALHTTTLTAFTLPLTPTTTVNRGSNVAQGLPRLYLGPPGFILPLTIPFLIAISRCHGVRIDPPVPSCLPPIVFCFALLGLPRIFFVLLLCRLDLLCLLLWPLADADALLWRNHRSSRPSIPSPLSSPSYTASSLTTPSPPWSTAARGLRRPPPIDTRPRGNTPPSSAGHTTFYSDSSSPSSPDEESPRYVAAIWILHIQR